MAIPLYKSKWCIWELWICILYVQMTLCKSKFKKKKNSSKIELRVQVLHFLWNIQEAIVHQILKLYFFNLKGSYFKNITAVSAFILELKDYSLYFLFFV